MIDVDGVDASINTQMIEKTHDILFHLAYLDNGRNPDIGTLKKDRAKYFQNVVHTRVKPITSMRPYCSHPGF